MIKEENIRFFYLQSCIFELLLVHLSVNCIQNEVFRYFILSFYSKSFNIIIVGAKIFANVVTKRFMSKDTESSSFATISYRFFRVTLKQWVPKWASRLGCLFVCVEINDQTVFRSISLIRLVSHVNLIY